MEISKLIMVSRAFDAVTASMAASENTMQEAIRTLGSTG
jgi:flagellar basal body rod protein FlgG